MEYEKKKNISKIISLIYLFFSLLILSYIIFRTEYYNLSYWYYKKYLIIIFFLIVFSLVSFYFSLKFKVNLSLTVISVILPIYLMEGLLTFNKWNNRIGDKRSYTQVYKDLKKDNKFILPTIPPSAFVNFKLKDYFPVSLIPNYEVINCNENGEYIVNKNDRYGFNTNDNVRTGKARYHKASNNISKRPARIASIVIAPSQLSFSGGHANSWMGLLLITQFTSSSLDTVMIISVWKG